MEPQHGLNILDYSVVSVIILSGLLALMRGFVREVLSLAAWIIAYFIAASDYRFAEPWTHQWIKNETGSIALAAVIVFVISLTVLTLAGWLIARMVRGRALTAIDRSLGFLFGLFRGVLIVCLVYLGATYIPWLNMDKLDKTGPASHVELDAINTPPMADLDKDKGEGKEDKDKDRDKPPEWLVTAKSRPALAYGAHILKAYIPDKEIEKTMQQYDEKYKEQNAAAHHEINVRTQEMLGIPGKPPEPPENKDNASKQ